MKWLIVVVGAMGLATTVSADGIRIAETVCDGSDGFPAVSANGETIAWLRCVDELSGAHHASFEVIRASDGQTLRSIPLLDRDENGRTTPRTRVRSAIRGATLVLARGGYVSLAPFAPDDESAVMFERGAVGPVRARYHSERAQLVVEDAESHRELLDTRIAPFEGLHGYCCGFEENPADRVCRLGATIRGLYLDPHRRFVLLDLVMHAGPDGCEEERVDVVPLRA